MEKIDLAGWPLSLSGMALIASILERDGCVEIVNCQTGCMGMAALSLGIAMADKVKELNGRQ